MVSINPVNMTMDGTALLTYAHTVTDGWFGSVVFALIYVLFLLWAIRSDNRMGSAAVSIVMAVIATILQSIGLINFVLTATVCLIALAHIIIVYWGV